MGDAAPDEPKSEATPTPEGDRPDWLVGAEDGVTAEFNRVEGGPSRTAPVIKLSRPGGDSGIESPGLSAQQVTGASAPPTPGATPHRGEAILDLQGGDSSSAAPYTPAAGSESLRLPAGGPRAAAAAKPEKKKAWVAAASSVPSLRVERRRVERKPDGAPLMDEQEEPAAEEFPDDNTPPTLGVVPGGKPTASAPVVSGPAPHKAPVLKEAMWLVVLDDIRTNRRTQILIGVALFLLLVWTFWPRNVNTVSISRLRAHAAEYDGSTVAVHGRVGEVFPVGAGYAYYLHQGRDTLVVFTRGSRPESKKTVTVTGSITTGFLDGRPRQALFEGQ